MNYFKRLNGLALMLMTMAALSVSAFAMEYSIETEENTEYYPSTSYEAMYGAAYNYRGSNFADYQIPELPPTVCPVQRRLALWRKGICPAYSKTLTLPFPAITDSLVGSMISPPALHL